MRKVRWGILGTANIARTQVIPAFQRSKNAEVVAIASLSGKENETACEFNIAKPYSSYEEVLSDQEIDAVYIPLPNHLHKKWVIKAAKAGKHVLCEKPVALTAEEAQELVDICHEKKVKFMEAFMYQFHPQHQRVRDILTSGEIGDVKLMRASFSFYLESRDENIRVDQTKGGGSIYDVGCYCIHAIRNILGTEPLEIDVLGEMDSKFGVDLSATGILKLENGVTAMFDCSMDMASRQEYEIVGTKGRIIVPRPYRPDQYGGEGLVIIQKDTIERIEKIYGDIYDLEVGHFSNAILEDSPILYSGENAVQNMRVIDACYASLKKQVAIHL